MVGDGEMKFQYEFPLCPVNSITVEVKDLLNLLPAWKRGQMIEPGGIGDQPAKYVDAMMMLEAMCANAEREAIEAMKGSK